MPILKKNVMYNTIANAKKIYYCKNKNSQIFVLVVNLM